MSLDLKQDKKGLRVPTKLSWSMSTTIGIKKLVACIINHHEPSSTVCISLDSKIANFDLWYLQLEC